MEQRPLRLGDIVDDYCPRERRLTNHAIVAVVGDVIKQTRCSTCDSEHVYKGGQVPKRRRKEDSAFDQVLADVTAGQLRPRVPADHADHPAVTGAAVEDTPPSQSQPVAAAAAGEPTDHDQVEEPVDDRPDEAWPAHRQLIRAQLPRTDADPPPTRPIPEFTMHQRQPQGRGGGFRHGWGNGNGNGNGYGNGFRQGRSGQGSGFGNGAAGQGRGRHRRRGGRKPK
jgi:hypothetical protein